MKGGYLYLNIKITHRFLDFGGFLYMQKNFSFHMIYLIYCFIVANLLDFVAFLGVELVLLLKNKHPHRDKCLSI